jgi:hypothetical protein
MKKLSIAILSLSLVIPMTAIAKDKKKPEVPEYIQKKWERREQDMKAYDKNKDGILQVDELKASSTAKFGAADKNKDGFISAEEQGVALDNMKTNVTKSYNELQANTETNRIKNRYKVADEDKDGQISAKEYQDFMGQHQRNFDQDGDGKISKQEYRMDGEKLPSQYRQNKKKDKSSR